MPSTRELRGINFPFGFGEDSFPETATGVDVILARVRSLLTTGRGEIPMIPNQGSIVHKYVFETMTPLMRSYLANEVRTQINTYVPQLKVTSVSTDVTDNRVVVNIYYVLDGSAGELAVDFGSPVR